MKVTFIPKPMKSNYNDAKVIHSVSLLPFSLKTMEKLVDRHIRDCILKEYPLHQNQFTYQTGKSTETVLHNVITYTGNAVTQKNSLRGLPCHRGAFDRTSSEVTMHAAERQHLWVGLLYARKQEHDNHTIRRDSEGSMARGCHGAWLWMNFYGDSMEMIVIHVMSQ
jgi:hypothetical protein